MQPYYFLDEISDDIPIIGMGNAAKITLDGHADASLDWRTAIESAKKYTNEGYRLFWELNLGLFDGLSAPLFDQTQFMTLGLSIQHFRNTIWKEFHQYSIGISLYQGSIDFSKQFKWDSHQIKELQEWLQERFLTTDLFNFETQLSVANFNGITPELLQQNRIGRGLFSLYCCDAAVDYLNLFAGQLPGELPVCVCLDTREISDPLLLAQLLSKERFDRLHRAITEGVLPIRSLTASPVHPFSNDVKIGFCLPNQIHCKPSLIESLKGTLDSLLSRKIPFRIIPESTLTVEWDGLDEILFSSKMVSQQGMRKLRGFAAAGGTVKDIVNLG